METRCQDFATASRKKSKSIPAIVIIVVALSALGGRSIIAQDSSQDKYTVKVPDGLAFSEFRGYETWQVVAISQDDKLLKAIVANPVMIEAYRAGVPGNGRPFPDGSKIAKFEWRPKKSAEAPFSVNVPDTLAAVGFIAKDSRRFPDSGGWGYAMFNYDTVSDRFTPKGTGAKCGAACHALVKTKDFIFTAYGRR